MALPSLQVYATGPYTEEISLIEIIIHFNIILLYCNFGCDAM
jgi:hypothetical protein